MTEKDNEIMEDDELIVVMTDEEGNEYYYREELIIPVGEDRFALLVEIQEDDCEDGCDEDGCDCGCGDENLVIAKIVVDENGEEVYVDPTDEEFEAVQKAYDELMEDDEEA